jgi:hypothetical protein
MERLVSAFEAHLARITDRGAPEVEVDTRGTNTLALPAAAKYPGAAELRVAREGWPTDGGYHNGLTRADFSP